MWQDRATVLEIGHIAQIGDGLGFIRDKKSVRTQRTALNLPNKAQCRPEHHHCRPPGPTGWRTPDAEADARPRMAGRTPVCVTPARPAGAPVGGCACPVRHGQSLAHPALARRRRPALSRPRPRLRRRRRRPRRRPHPAPQVRCLQCVCPPLRGPC